MKDAFMGLAEVLAAKGEIYEKSNVRVYGNIFSLGLASTGEY